MSEIEQEHSAALEEELHEIKGALLNDTIRTLGPDEPLCVAETVSVGDAVASMMAMRRAAVLVVDGDGRLVGLFTERDVLMWVVGVGVDEVVKSVREVMWWDRGVL